MPSSSDKYVLSHLLTQILMPFQGLLIVQMMKSYSSFAQAFVIEPIDILIIYIVRQVLSPYNIRW